MTKRDVKAVLIILAVFLAFYFIPIGNERISNALVESVALVQWYAKEHMFFGLLPAFFIAGAISAFVSKGAVMRYLGARAKRHVAYAVASVSGCILAVCSCTILPLFAGIYSRGAGLGPATTFLYAGPAINVMAIILTARVLGMKIGIARAVGAIAFSIVIGLLMHLIFRKEETVRADAALAVPEEHGERPIRHSLAMFAGMIAVLAFANWQVTEGGAGLAHAVFRVKWLLTGLAGLALGGFLVAWFRGKLWVLIATATVVAVLAFLYPDQPHIAFLTGIAGIVALALSGGSESREWVDGSWGFAQEILPLLLIGILAVGALLGRQEHDALIPARWITDLVGGNSLRANLVASLSGGLMYFCTMTEIPIVQGLLGAGMGKGPALAFLLAGPAVSLPNVLILRKVIGTKRTMVYLTLVVIMATATGALFGLMGG
jgi:uncharacterized membrane protein YraQ (UPF0718 family)